MMLMSVLFHLWLYLRNQASVFVFLKVYYTVGNDCWLTTFAIPVITSFFVRNEQAQNI